MTVMVDKTTDGTTMATGQHGDGRHDDGKGQQGDRHLDDGDEQQDDAVRFPNNIKYIFSYITSLFYYLYVFNAVADMLPTCQKTRHLVCHVGTLGDTFLHHVGNMSSDMSTTCRPRHFMSVFWGVWPTCRHADIRHLPTKLQVGSGWDLWVKVRKIAWLHVYVSGSARFNTGSTNSTDSSLGSVLVD